MITSLYPYISYRSTKHREGEFKMPLFDYECTSCGHVQELLVPSNLDTDIPCSKCGAQSKKLPSVASFKIKGLRAANGYGLKFMDTPGKDAKTQEESGYSYTSTKGNTIDHNQGA
jgi:putative FmdB family regulatory protein